MIESATKIMAFKGVAVNWDKDVGQSPSNRLGVFMMILRARFILFALFASLLTFPTSVFATHAGWDDTTQASNRDSIANTRHNLSLAYNTQRNQMNDARNDYDRVCVYCHTPHGANTTMLSAPLWNRTNQVAMGTTYTLYGGGLSSAGQTVTQPGISSLTCLSCHDGTVAIDSIINMPGSGGYDQAQETSVNDAFLDSWTGNPDGSRTDTHSVLGPGSSSCASASCHSPTGGFGAPDFSAFIIGTDLNNDHPIGVQMPNAVLYGFNEPTATDGNKWFFDADGDGRADRGEIRLYKTVESQGYEVECASCHDPHGVVPGGGTVGLLNPSFLRVNNSGSRVCLTCHIK